jgi:hypothetical protein
MVVYVIVDEALAYSEFAERGKVLDVIPAGLWSKAIRIFARIEADCYKLFSHGTKILSPPDNQGCRPHSKESARYN